jgi:hypothetical protein
MLTTETKKKIIASMTERRATFGSDGKFAANLGINAAQYSRIMKGELDAVLSDSKWIAIARKLDVQIDNNKAWFVARTPVFEYITTQLATCQRLHTSSLLCDASDIGKTFTAKEYVKHNKYAVYVDCSQSKTKAKLVRQIAKELGLDAVGRYADVYQDLVFYLRSLPNPLIILDEFGDLDYQAFMEVKALWNATEGCCGWYAMGADGLRAKLVAGYNQKRVGYAEILSRFGVHDERVKTQMARFQKITPDGNEAMTDFVKTQVAIIGKANGVTELAKLYAKTGGSLRRVRTEVLKSVQVGGEQVNVGATLAVAHQTIQNN